MGGSGPEGWGLVTHRGTEQIRKYIEDNGSRFLTVSEGRYRY